MGKKQQDEPSHEKNNLVSPKPSFGTVPEQAVNQIAGGSTHQLPPEDDPGNTLLPSDLQGPSSNTKQGDPPQSIPLTPKQTEPSTSSHCAEQEKATELVSAEPPTTDEDTGGMSTEASQHNNGTALENIPLAETKFMSPQPGTSGYSGHNASPQNDLLPSTKAGVFNTSNNLEQVNADIVSLATRTDSEDSENVVLHDAGGPKSLPDSDEEIPEDKDISQSQQISYGASGVIEPDNENPGPSHQAGSADSTLALQNIHLSPQPRPSRGSQKRSLSPFQPGPSTGSGNLEQDRNADNRDSSVSKRMKPSTAEQAGNVPPDGEAQESNEEERDDLGSEVELMLALALEAIENGRFLSNDQLSVQVRAFMENGPLWPVLVIDNSGENEDDNQDSPMEHETPDGEELEGLQDNEFISFYKDPNYGRSNEDNDDFDDPPLIN